jgi:hypothetical protein
MGTLLRKIGVVAFVLAISTATGISHDHATGIVKERMDMMELSPKA